jgi:hypothetical protein
MPELKIIPMSIILPLRNNRKEILLGYKSSDAKIGANTRSPYGGVKHRHETNLGCAAREFKEESLVQLKKTELISVGTLDFFRPETPDVTKVSRCHLYIFDWLKKHNVPQSTKEMQFPLWYDVDRLPYNDLVNNQRLMLEDCEIWMPRILIDGQMISGHFDFNLQGILQFWKIKSVGTIPK